LQICARRVDIICTARSPRNRHPRRKPQQVCEGAVKVDRQRRSAVFRNNRNQHDLLDQAPEIRTLT